jgi:hypothetical protein
VRTIEELRTEKLQLELQLAVAHLAAKGAVASETSTRTALEPRRSPRRAAQ